MPPNLKAEKLFLQGKLPKMLKRFWLRLSAVDKSKDKCWLWPGTTTYGAIESHRIRLQAHRVSFMIHHGAIPDGHRVLHNCPSGDKPPCVNPNHLYSGTESQNQLDAIQKGRKPILRGEMNGASKLNKEKVEAIRKWKLTRLQLSKKYGVSRSQIDHVINRVHWS